MLRYTKKKKLHEVEAAANVINGVAQHLGGGCAVVDCGAGAARLSHCLSMQFELDVCAVEASGAHAASGVR